MTVMCFVSRVLLEAGGRSHDVMCFVSRVLLEAWGRSHDSNVFCFTCYWRMCCLLQELLE